MATLYATGVDGNVTLPAAIGYRVDSWAATFSQVVVNITGFDSSGWAAFQGALKSGRGTFTGTPKYNNTNTSPGFQAIDPLGASATFRVAAASGGLGGDVDCKFSGNIIVTDESFSVDVNGASRITASFVFTSTITVTWDENPPP